MTAGQSLAFFVKRFLHREHMATDSLMLNSDRRVVPYADGLLLVVKKLQLQRDVGNYLRMQACGKQRGAETHGAHKTSLRMIPERQWNAVYGDVWLVTLFR